MTSYRKQRRERNRLRMSAMGKASQRAQAAKRMMLVTPEYLHDLAEIETLNFPRKQGDALGCLEWRNFRSGKVRRWVVRIGDRIDRITVESPGKKQSPSHGWTWFLTQLRKHLS